MNELKGTQNIAKLLFGVLKENLYKWKPTDFLMEFKKVLDPLKDIGEANAEEII